MLVNRYPFWPFWSGETPRRFVLLVTIASRLALVSESAFISSGVMASFCRIASLTAC